MVGKLLYNKVYDSANSLRQAGVAEKSVFGTGIRVLVWNIYKARRVDWLDDFASLLPRHDLVMLQEAVFNGTHDSVFEQDRRFEWHMARSFRTRYSHLDTGVKTGCRIASIDAAPLFSPFNEPIINTPKLALTASYPLADNQTLLTCNVHAINFVMLKRYQSQITQVMEACARHEGPVILAGDFNTWSAQRFQRFRSAALDIGLQEAVFERRAPWRHLYFHLDHVYYKGLAIQQIETLHHVRSSDHFPISVRFGL